jgi:hypothetical protein
VERTGRAGARGAPAGRARSFSPQPPRRTLQRAVAQATPALLTAVLSFAGAVDVLRLPTGAAPVRIGLVLLVLAAGTGFTIALDRPLVRPYWQMMLGVALILMPIVALQAYASRVPFVAIGRGSAGPLLLLTFATCVALLALWLFAAIQSDEEPENSALLFLPAALLVPAILGAPGSLGETSALTMLGEASLVAGAATIVGLVSPPNWRPLAGGAALGVQFVLLWLLGRGPILGHDSGAVVPASAVLILGLTALLTVLAPLGALVSRRFFQTVEEQSDVPRQTPVPPRGSRRQDAR